MTWRPRHRKPGCCQHQRRHALADNNVEAVVCTDCGLLLETRLSERFRPPLDLDRPQPLVAGRKPLSNEWE